MSRVTSRPRRQTVALVVVSTAALAGVVYVFRANPLIQAAIFAALGAGVSLTALREETRRGRLSRLFMGPFVFSVFLATVAEMDAALVLAVAFWALTVYYGFSDAVSETR